MAVKNVVKMTNVRIIFQLSGDRLGMWCGIHTERSGVIGGDDLSYDRH